MVGIQYDMFEEWSPAFLNKPIYRYRFEIIIRLLSIFTLQQHSIISIYRKNYCPLRGGGRFISRSRRALSKTTAKLSWKLCSCRKWNWIKKCSIGKENTVRPYSAASFVGFTAAAQTFHFSTVSIQLLLTYYYTRRGLCLQGVLFHFTVFKQLHEFPYVIQEVRCFAYQKKEDLLSRTFIWRRTYWANIIRANELIVLTNFDITRISCVNIRTQSSFCKAFYFPLMRLRILSRDFQWKTRRDGK